MRTSSPLTNPTSNLTASDLKVAPTQAPDNVVELSSLKTSSNRYFINCPKQESEPRALSTQEQEIFKSLVDAIIELNGQDAEVMHGSAMSVALTKRLAHYDKIGALRIIDPASEAKLAQIDGGVQDYFNARDIVINSAISFLVSLGEQGRLMAIKEFVDQEPDYSSFIVDLFVNNCQGTPQFAAEMLELTNCFGQDAAFFCKSRLLDWALNPFAGDTSKILHQLVDLYEAKSEQLKECLSTPETRKDFESQLEGCMAWSCLDESLVERLIKLNQAMGLPIGKSLLIAQPFFKLSKAEQTRTTCSGNRKAWEDLNNEYEVNLKIQKSTEILSELAQSSSALEAAKTLSTLYTKREFMAREEQEPNEKTVREGIPTALLELHKKDPKVALDAALVLATCPTPAIFAGLTSFREQLFERNKTNLDLIKELDLQLIKAHSYTAPNNQVGNSQIFDQLLQIATSKSQPSLSDSAVIEVLRSASTYPYTNWRYADSASLPLQDPTFLSRLETIALGAKPNQPIYTDLRKLLATALLYEPADCNQYAKPCMQEKRLNLLDDPKAKTIKNHLYSVKERFLSYWGQTPSLG